MFSSCLFIFIFFVVTHFWVLPSYILFSEKKKKPEHFERIVLLLPYACRGREEEDFKCFFPLSLSTPLA
jgi:hypothetical protein